MAAVTSSPFGIMRQRALGAALALALSLLPRGSTMQLLRNGTLEAENLAGVGSDAGPGETLATSCSADSLALALVEFGTRPLTGLARISKPRTPLQFPRVNDRDRRILGVYVNPPMKFAFCYIEKVACSVWTSVLWKTLENETYTRGASVRRNPYSVDRFSQQQFGAEGMEAVFRDPLATRAVFIREPLSRFLSAFLNKCFDHQCKRTDGTCPFRRKEDVGKAVVFKRAVEAMLLLDPGDRYLDPHYRIQSHHCDLKHRVHEYNVVGLMRPDTLDSDAACLMEKAGLSRFNNRGPPSNAPFWRTDAGTSHVKPPKMSEEDTLKRFFTKEAARSLIAHFHDDYKTFNLEPEPRWVADATGEWYGVEPDGCRPAGGEAHTLYEGDAENDDNDEDDLVKLTRRAGYGIS